MDSVTVEWSELCNTDSSVALAYYLSQAFLPSFPRSERLEAVGAYRDVVRNFVRVGACRHGGGGRSGDGCVDGGGRDFASVSCDTGLGYRRLLSDCGRFCGGVQGSVSWGCAGGISEALGNDVADSRTCDSGDAGATRVGGEQERTSDRGSVVDGGSAAVGVGRVDGGNAWVDADAEVVGSSEGDRPVEVCEADSYETGHSASPCSGRGLGGGQGLGSQCRGGDAGSGDVSQGVCGNTSASVLKGKNYEKNKAKRERQKRKRRDVEGIQEKTKLQKSSEEKWEAQNRLATLEAERKIALIEARDIEQERRSDRARIQRNLERSLVAIEKTHATLRATGNVPGEMGFCETVVGSGSISPDSSASQADIRAMKKELEDGKAENANLRALLERHGIAAVDSALYDKQTWTQNEENFELLDQLYPGGYALNDLYASDGKARVVPC